jgi:hypothetical protein
MTADFDDTARRMSDTYWAAKFAPLIPEPARDQARIEIERLVADARDGRRRRLQRNPEKHQAARARWNVEARRAAGSGDEAGRKYAAHTAAVYDNMIQDSRGRRDDLLAILYGDVFRIWIDVVGRHLRASTPSMGAGRPYGPLVRFVSAITDLVGVAPKSIKEAIIRERHYRKDGFASSWRASKRHI